jgi:mRNA interferase RelE/StbE
LPKFILDGFIKKFKLLAENPHLMSGVETIKNPNSIGLEFEKAFRIRVENYGAIYAIEDEIVTITIIEVEHRSKVYRKK